MKKLFILMVLFLSACGRTEWELIAYQNKEDLIPTYRFDMATEEDCEKARAQFIERGGHGVCIPPNIMRKDDE